MIPLAGAHFTHVTESEFTFVLGILLGVCLVLLFVHGKLKG